MNIKDIFKKGYLLEIESYEGDGDYTTTKYLRVDSFKEAKDIQHVLLNLFGSCNMVSGTLGNKSYQDLENAHTTIEKFVEDTQNNTICNRALEDVDGVVGHIEKLLYDSLGSSEVYLYRVAYSVEIYYVNESVNIDKVG